MAATQSFLLAVESEHAGERLDRFLARALPQFTRAYLQTRIDAGDIRVDRKLRKPSFRLRGSEQIAVLIPEEPSKTALIPEHMSLMILYEDTDVIVVDKPAGLVVHPGAGNWTGTLVHGILAHAPEVRTNDEIRPGIVHRLDKDTSGVLIVAKHDVAREFLARQLRERTAHKEYIALVHGIVPRDLTIEAPIGRDPVHRTRMAVVSNGREATSILHVVERLPGYTLLTIDLRSGRTHQIRVHCAYIGHPVAGDRRYAQRRTPPPALTRQFLHAARLEIRLPNGTQRTFVSPLPNDLNVVLNALHSSSESSILTG